MNKSKILIIGGGPAGSSAAYFLAKQGIDVTLLDKDKWPRDKICGGGLTANCLPILERMGAIEELDNIADFKFDGFAIYSTDGQKVQSPVRQRDGKGKSKEVPYCYVVKRDYFDQILLNKAIESGANVITEIKAIKVVQDENGIKVTTKNEQLFEADVLIVADGSGGPITRQFQKDLHKGSAIAVRGYYSNIRNISSILEFFLDDELGFGYGWIFPLGDGKANVGAGLDVEYLKKRNKNVRKVYAEMLKSPHISNKMDEAILEGKLETFPLRMGYDKDAFRKDRVLFVGDSAKLIYPLSGEGIAYALQSGEMAANVISDVISKIPVDYSLLSRYEVQCWRAFNDFKYASKLQKLMGRPRVQKFFFNNSVYNYDLGQRAMGILEHSSDVSSFFNAKTMSKSLLVAAKRTLKNIKSPRDPSV